MKKYVCSLYHGTSSLVWFFPSFMYCMLICCVLTHRCEESTSSPGVSNSIGEGIIEEEEEEEVEEESNKKRMKEDDQEVLSPLFFVFLC